MECKGTHALTCSFSHDPVKPSVGYSQLITDSPWNLWEVNACGKLFVMVTNFYEASEKYATTEFKILHCTLIVMFINCIRNVNCYLLNQGIRIKL